MKSTRKEVKSEIWGEVADSIWHQIGYRAKIKVWGKVRDPVSEQIESRVVHLIFDQAK